MPDHVYTTAALQLFNRWKKPVSEKPIQIPGLEWQEMMKKGESKSKEEKDREKAFNDIETKLIAIRDSNATDEAKKQQVLDFLKSSASAGGLMAAGVAYISTNLKNQVDNVTFPNAEQFVSASSMQSLFNKQFTGKTSGNPAQIQLFAETPDALAKMTAALQQVGAKSTPISENGKSGVSLGIKENDFLFGDKNFMARLDKAFKAELAKSTAPAADASKTTVTRLRR